MQVVVDGILTHFEKVGDGKQKLLILHGWMRNLHEWLGVAKDLSDKYEVFLLDLPGMGQTPRPTETFSIYDYAVFVEHFLDKVGIENVTLLGHSFGGRIGIIMGAKTLVPTASPDPKHTPSPQPSPSRGEGEQGRNYIEHLILVDAAGVEKRSMQAKLKLTFFKMVKVFLPKQTIEHIRHKLGSLDYKTAGNMRDIFIKVINEDLTYLLPKITAKTDIIWGEKDTEVPLWKTKLMKKLIPNSRLRVVWGAGHSPYLEKPREFMEIIREDLL